MLKNSSLQKKFRVALAIAGTSAKNIAEENGVSGTTIAYVVSGRATSARISKVIKTFIDRHVPRELQHSLDRE